MKTVDIEKQTCPMTTVYVRLAFDAAAVGETLEILLKGEETKKNVLSLLKTLNQEDIMIIQTDEASAFYRIMVNKL